MTDERGTLYLVATPIGNMGDITLRAIEVLRMVDVVAAEDTRLTRRLWTRHEIETPLISYHAHSGDGRREQLLARLEDGEDIALVSDAGTPLVSDPGEDLVADWAAAGGTVVPIPGASAVLAAVVASGVAGARWGFEGFLPRKGRVRQDRLLRIAADDRATVLFESPGRTATTLADLVQACGAERKAAVCRELTKRYEEIRRGSLAELVDAVMARPLKGEIVIVIAGSPQSEGASVGLADGRARVERLVAEGVKRSVAARIVADDTGLPRRELFTPDET